MTDVQTTDTATTEAEQAIASLKKQADRLGISYKSNTSIATLQKAIAEKLDAPVGGSDSKEESDTGTTSKASKAKSIESAHKEAMKLVRVIITPMDSNKAANLESDIFCAGNSVVGTVKRTIPFGVEWHVEQILLNTIREKTYQAFTTVKNARGESVTKTRTIPAYNIVELPPLTDQELKALADQQARTRSLEDE